ncbi:hypothetical protein PSI9734_00908 [Pseudidiomarina piscicola]|uniref:Solute-binding protein family 3/N-terminal domain-containing protein n=1 Tax=Pseudidiomarina piscicola TaxID=2614830 RepID=A0A6S6WMB4_9GAMM|nr:hypothetical protein [Pseudidiomarina piscicola]CAB0150355.1 hypothetical protein PSI9734_00908 [Pseudidiomarina piscicola]VZT39783.1 hypothetical protein PSI9734_00908 [Pseudomonas aeruginosa]
MHLVRHLTLSLLLFVGLLPNLQANEDEIVWGVNHAPPFHIADGYLADQGVCDLMIDAFARALPETSQSVLRYPQSRIAALIRQGKNLCFPCLIKRAQDTDFVYFSNATLEYPAHGIITRPELAKEFERRFGNPVDLVELLKTGDYRFGQPLGRAYGSLQPYIDRFLHNTSRFSEISGRNANANMLAMVNAERLDFAIDYPILLNYHNDILPIDLVFMPIKQNYEQPVEGAVGCAATPWGRKAIDKINSAIPQVIEDLKFRTAKDRWLMPRNP